MCKQTEETKECNYPSFELSRNHFRNLELLQNLKIFLFFLDLKQEADEIVEFLKMRLRYNVNSSKIYNLTTI